MYTLENWQRKKRFPTEDFPMTVYYYKATQGRTEHYPPSRHPELEAILVHQGIVEVFTAEGKRLLHAGEIALFDPNVLHGTRPVENVVEISVKFPLELIELPPQDYFRKAFIEPMRSGRLRMPPFLTREHPAYPRICGLLTKLHPSKEGTVGYRELLLETAFNLCTSILPYCSTGKDVQQNNLGSVEACIQYINKHYQERITLSQLAGYVGLHPNYLCARFKSIVGQTVIEYLTRIRLEQALDLLSNTELSATEVCHRCGFNSTDFFTKKFKACYGLTPKQAHKQKFKPYL